MPTILKKPTIGESYLRDVAIETRQSSDGKRTTVIINTSDVVDTYQTIIEPSGVRLDRYTKNPIVLISHDYMLVAGTSTVALRGGQLVAEMSDDEWDHEDPEIEKWFRKVKKGILRTASVGFLIHAFSEEMVDDKPIWRITDWTLLEWSFCAVPSNSNALVTERAIDELMPMLMKMQSDIEALTKATQAAQQRLTESTPEPPAGVPAASEPAPQVLVPAANKNTQPTTRTATDEELTRIIDNVSPRIVSLVRRKLGKE